MSEQQVDGVSGAIRIWAVRIYDAYEAAAASGFPKNPNIGDDAFDSACEKAQQRLDRLSHCEPGSGHDCALGGVLVSMNITAPRYWWQEMMRYHFVEPVSATSTMHSLMSALQATGYDDVDATMELFAPGTDRSAVRMFLSYAREKASEGYDGDALLTVLKRALPESFMMTMRVATNYRQLKTIFRQRKSHRLQEWQDFCAWVLTLPMSGMLIARTPLEERADRLMYENMELKARTGSLEMDNAMDTVDACGTGELREDADGCIAPEGWTMEQPGEPAIPSPPYTPGEPVMPMGPSDPVSPVPVS